MSRYPEASHAFPSSTDGCGLGTRNGRLRAEHRNCAERPAHRVEITTLIHLDPGHVVAIVHQRRNEGPKIRRDAIRILPRQMGPIPREILAGSEERVVSAAVHAFFDREKLFMRQRSAGVEPFVAKTDRKAGVVDALNVRKVGVALRHVGKTCRGPFRKFNCRDG